MCVCVCAIENDRIKHKTGHQNGLNWIAQLYEHQTHLIVNNKCLKCETHPATPNYPCMGQQVHVLVELWEVKRDWTRVAMD